MQTQGETPLTPTDATAPAQPSAQASQPDTEGRAIPDRQIVIMLVALAAAIYLRTVARDVLAGDAGEFHFTVWRLGLSHPTGYPTYMIAGHLWQKLLALAGLSPALALNAFSAVMGALSLGQLYFLMRRWLPAAELGSRGLSQGIAVFTALLFGWNLTYWSQNLIAEVYTLHVVFVLAIFGAAYRLHPGQADRLLATEPRAEISPSSQDTPKGLPAGRGLIILSALVGLSLTHHGMTLFLLPALLLYLFTVHRQWYRQSWRVWVGMILAAAAPLLLYLYVPLRSGPDASPWYHQRLGDETLTLYAGDWDAFIQFITGRSISVGFNTPAAALEQLGFAFWLWRFHFTAAGLLLVGLGLFVLIRNRRYTILALTSGYALTQQLFNLFYNIEDILVYYIPLYLMGAIWAGFGAYALVTAALRAGQSTADSRTGAENPPADEDSTPDAAPSKETTSAPQPIPQTDTGPIRPGGLQWSSRLAWVAMILLFLLPLTALINNMGLVDQSQSTGARDQWEAILAATPSEDAILVTNDRDEIVGLLYMQWVEERRRDLTGLFPLMAPDERFTDIGATLVTALQAGNQPVYLIKDMPGLEIAFVLEAASPPLVRVVGQHETLPSMRIDMEPVNAELGPLRLEGYEWTPASIDNADTEQANQENEPASGIEIQLYWRVLAPVPGDYTTTVQLFDAAGERLGQSDAPPGGVFYPTSLWKTGEQIIETHQLAVDFQGDADARVLLIGMYDPDSMEHLAPALELSLTPPAHE